MAAASIFPRWLSSPSVSAFINVCAIFFLCANLLSNYYLPLSRQHNNNDQQQIMNPIPTNGQFQSKQRRDASKINGISLDNNDVYDSLAIPRGKAVAMPSIRIPEDEEKKIKRDQYGGVGDKPHLGGFTEFDPLGVSPSLWKHMVSYFGVKSLLDVGCGKGVSTSWFVTHGLDFVQCVEGSHDAVSQSIIPNSEQYVVEHDFSRGAWWPDRTVDAAWAVEFTEHVGRNYQPNYITAFRKAALIFVTHSNWGGWHHVEVHDDDWWRARWEAAGFVYSDFLTQKSRSIAMQDQNLKDLTLDMKPDNLYFVGQHVYLNVQVFINPRVASLPQHSHLFAEHGCFAGKDKNNNKILVDCNDAGARGEVLTPLPENFKPLKLTEKMDKAWFDLVKNFKTNGRPMAGLRRNNNK